MEIKICLACHTITANCFVQYSLLYVLIVVCLTILGEHYTQLIGPGMRYIWYIRENYTLQMLTNKKICFHRTQMAPLSAKECKCITPEQKKCVKVPNRNWPSFYSPWRQMISIRMNLCHWEESNTRHTYLLLFVIHIVV